MGTKNGPKGQRPPATALVVAAGSGRRLGAELPKALVPVGGRPMFQWSLLAAGAASRIGSIVLAVPAGREREFGPPPELAGAATVRVVAGGASRSESVLRALAGVETSSVLVHDAARPLVTPSLFNAVLERLEADEGLAGVVAAAPVTDTIKRCRADSDGTPRVLETLDRSELWAVQTPQAFRTEILRAALEQPDVLASATDDAMLVEALGHRVAVLPSTAGNFKVTTPEDLARAEITLPLASDR